MSRITDSELESLREAQLEFMPDICRIYRKVESNGEVDWVQVGGDIVCRISPILGSLWRGVADKFQGLTGYMITVPLETQVKDGWRIYNEQGQGPFLVRDVKAVSSFHTALMITAEMIDNA